MNGESTMVPTCARRIRARIRSCRSSTTDVCVSRLCCLCEAGEKRRRDFTWCSRYTVALYWSLDHATHRRNANSCICIPCTTRAGVAKHPWLAHPSSVSALVTRYNESLLYSLRLGHRAREHASRMRVALLAHTREQRPQLRHAQLAIVILIRHV